MQRVAVRKLLMVAAFPVALCGGVAHAQSEGRYIGGRHIPNGVALSGAFVLASLGLLLVAAIPGSPVFATLGRFAPILFWGRGLPIASITPDHYRLVVNPSPPMIAPFTLAGYFLAAGLLFVVFLPWLATGLLAQPQ